MPIVNLDKDSKIKLWVVASHMAVELDAVQVSRGSRFVVDTRSDQVIPMVILLLSAHALLDQALLHSHDYPIHLTTGLDQKQPTCLPIPSLWFPW